MAFRDMNHYGFHIPILYAFPHLFSNSQFDTITSEIGKEHVYESILDMAIV